jgi:nucleoside-diphosphate-sugar epimerase
MLSGKKVIVHDDGLAQNPFTHAKDFSKGLVGLFMNERAYGEAFHITSDEILSWRDVTQMVADASGTKAIICCIPSIELVRMMPKTPHGDTYGVILCAKAHNKIYDNSKIKNAVPEFNASISFSEGVRDTLDYYNQHPELKMVDKFWDTEVDRVIKQYESRL